MRSIIDATADHTLLSKTEDEAYNLMPKITLNNYQWSNKRGQPKRVRGKFDVNASLYILLKWMR